MKLFSLVLTQNLEIDNKFVINTVKGYPLSLYFGSDLLKSSIGCSF